MMPGDAAWDLMATHTCRIYGPPAVVDGKRGEPTLVKGDTPCWPLDYLSMQAQQRLGIDAPARVRGTYIEGRVSVRAGTLVYDGARYPIRETGPADWAGPGEGEFSVIAVEATEASK